MISIVFTSWIINEFCKIINKMMIVKILGRILLEF